MNVNPGSLRAFCSSREPFSEEENWLAAAEWADKHGANIISSSLGYTYHRYFNTEMLQLDISGGNLPGGVMVRESPSKASLGRTSVRLLSNGQDDISSFFDVSTEVTLDGGQSWSPATNGPVRMELSHQSIEVPAPFPVLPVTNTPYVSPAQWHALYANGIVITNGPGDPAAIPQITHNAKLLLDAALERGGARPLPILGICLGHQLIGRAIGATTSRLPFGHHGANHPVQDVRTGRVVITSQNHEFQVDEASIPSESGFSVSARNLNDGSVEGLAHRTLPIRTYQYHPEGAPGPRDNEPVFDRFMDDVRDAVARRS